MMPRPRLLLLPLCASLLTSSACLPARTAVPAPLHTLPTPSPAPIPAAVPTPAQILSIPTAVPLVPNFSHIEIVVFENRECGLELADDWLKELRAAR